MSEQGEAKTSSGSEPAADQPSLIGQPTPTSTPDSASVDPNAPSAEPPKPAEPEGPLTADSIKIPEGMIVDDASRDEFLGVMNNADLTPQARAQALIDLQSKAMQAVSERGNKLWSDMQETWVKDARTQMGEGLEPALGNISKLLDQFGGTAEQIKELRDVFTLTGAGNHPAMIRFLDNLGKPIREGQARGGAPSGGTRTPESILYPTMNQG